MLFRYAILVAMVLGSLYGVLITGASTGQVLLVDAGMSAAAPEYSLWALAGIVAFSAVSLFRFMIFGMPSMLTEWCTDNREWLGWALLGVLVIIVFYWL
ncbi:hypothetical protein V6C03_10200 [Methyloligella sp. 2.7D]|uniref:hypothetical protein n=1 Tax=unclassified Methyloligella TaxID=2625955 RepID=UPI00157D893E|nr:hypothetical protein [Methyloligella sp. GL2]QKP77791.1 hypothetical protein HT051_10255 [Methyloligella sp. GL2]